MKHLFRFRTGHLTTEQLPQLPKPSRALGFTSGVLTGTVVAAVMISGPGRGQNVLAMVDVSRSMQGLEAKLKSHWERLGRQGVVPIRVDMVGFGVSTRSGDGLLQSLRAALQANPSVQQVYIFSDFSCESRGYDRDDEAGLKKLDELIQNRQLIIASLRDPPGERLVTLARTSPRAPDSPKEKGGWIDEQGNYIKDDAFGPPGTGTVAGAVRNAVGGKVIANARVTLDSSSTDSDETGNFRFTGVVPGSHKLVVTHDAFVSTSLEFQLTDCPSSLTQNVSLTEKVGPGEYRITLNWRQEDGVPDDLDMHLTGPNDTQVYFDNRKVPGAELEYDNVDPSGSHSPHPPTETMHVTPQELAGKYTLDVCDFKDERRTRDGIARSQVVVQVYGPAGLLHTYPAPGGMGRRWRVFTIDPQSGLLTKLNSMDSGDDLLRCF